MRKSKLKQLICALLLSICLIIYISMVLPSFLTNPQFTTSCLVQNKSDDNYFIKTCPTNNNIPFYDLPKNDETKLNNLTDFHFHINKPYICHDFPELLLLVLVPSAPKNSYRRNTIRETWGKSDKEIKVLFIFGAVTDEETQEILDEENRMHQDIIQGSFLDTYYNLTYKTVTCLKYVVYYCRTVKYILKIDDDSVVNMPLMRNFLKNDISAYGAESLLFCDVLRNITPIRDKSFPFYGKWAVSYEEYPKETYPTYCVGWVSLFTPDVAFKLYKQAQDTPFFSWEDVFLYGMVVEKVDGLIHTDFTSYTLTYYWIKNLIAGDYGEVDFLVGTFDMDDALIRQLWQYLQERPVKKSLVKIDNVVSENNSIFQP